MYEGLDKNNDIIEAICFTNIARNKVYADTPPEELFAMYEIIAFQWKLNPREELHRILIERELFKSTEQN